MENNGMIMMDNNDNVSDDNKDSRARVNDSINVLPGIKEDMLQLFCHKVLPKRFF